MKYIKYLGLLLVGLFMFSFNVKAETIKTYVNLSTLEVSEDGKSYSSIKEYKTLDEFLEDYNSDNLPKIYITDFLFDGVGAVKTPDLDDFIEANSNDTKIKTLEIKVININTTGDIELTGKIKGAMIGVNTNGVKGEINLVLNGVNLDTDSKKAPAVYVYNKDKNYTDCKVSINTVAGTKNYLEGGKLKKVSLLGSDELSSYESKYSGSASTNYKNYSSYYGIYTSEQIKNILFATVITDNEDLSDGDPYYFYKASGAISSDIDLYFNGDGYLKVTSKNKEGIETKGNLSFTGGNGDYEIIAQDDCLNTTTSSSVESNARNDLVIDVNSLIAKVAEDADEGDAIDSNGTLTINNGTIIAIAHPTSGDAGLDSQNGTYINGGTVLATGNMTDPISADSKNKNIYVTFNSKIAADTLIVIKDQDDKVITAYKTDRTIGNLLYSSADLDYESFKIYTGGTIDGEEENGLYTKINSYSGGEEVSYSVVQNSMNNRNSNSSTNKTRKFLIISLIVEFGLLIAVLLLAKFVILKD